MVAATQRHSTRYLRLVHAKSLPILTADTLIEIPTEAKFFHTLPQARATSPAARERCRQCAPLARVLHEGTGVLRVTASDKVADSLMGKGCCLEERGKYEEARVEYQKSLDIKTRIPDNHLDVAEIRENMAIIIGNKATTTKPLKSTSLFWKSRSAYTVKTPWMWRTRSTTWLRCTSVRETTYRQKRWPLRHTIHSLRC